MVCWWQRCDSSCTRPIAPVAATTSIILSSDKSQNRNILAPANPGSPGKMAVNRRGRDTLVQELGRAYQGRTFTGTWEQLWPEILPATTNDSYDYQWELNSGSLAQVRHLNHGCFLTYQLTYKKALSHTVGEFYLYSEKDHVLYYAPAPNRWGH